MGRPWPAQTPDMNMDELLELLVCPGCRSRLTPLPDSKLPEGLCCPRCQKVYPIREDIPVMLVEEAISITQWKAGVRSGGKG